MGKNLSDWKQVATQPQLRQDYTQNVIQPRVQQMVSNIQQPSSNLWKNVSQSPYFNPTTQAKPNLISPIKQYTQPQNFWTSKAGLALGKAQEFIESPQAIRPFPTLFKTTPEMSGLEQFKRGIYNLPTEIGNTIIGQGILDPMSDVGQSLGRNIGGRELADYKNLKSGVGRLGQQLGGVAPTNPKEVIGNLADVAIPIATAYAPKGLKVIAGATKPTLMLTIKGGSKMGAKFGGAFGFLEALSSGREIKDNTAYFENLAVKTGLGVGFGTFLGALTSAGGYGFQKIVSAVKKVLPKATEKESRLIAGRFLQDETGRFMGSTKKEPKTYGDLREELGMPRHGYTPEDVPVGFSVKPKGGTKAIMENVAPLVESATPVLKQKPTIPVKETVVGGGQPNTLGSVSSPTILSDKDLVSQLTKAIKEAKPLRGAQEALYTKARGQKLARLIKARSKMAGEKGFYQELGALKGELPKVEYESVRQNFTQGNVDRLYNMIKSNKGLDEWEKVNTQVGLSKILGQKGSGVPTKGELENLYTVFGKEFTETLLAKRPVFEKLAEAGMQLYNIPRSMMAGVGDLSATLMQNIMFAYRHPLMTGKNFVKQLKFFVSDNAYKLSGEEIAQRPNYQAMKQAKISFTDVSPIVSKREEQFMASWAEKIPGLGKLIRATGRAYTGFLNRMRADTFDQLYNSAKQLGKDVKSDKFLRDLGELVNAGTGRGDLGALERSSNILAQGFFSARKLAAAAYWVNPVKYVKADPFVRKEMFKTMLAYMAGGSTLLGLAKLGGASVGTDPTSTDYGKIKVGNTRFNVWGTHQQLVVLLARVFKGYATSSTTGKKMTLGEGYKPLTRLELMTRFFESKEHPTLSLITGALQGQNQIGEDFNLSTEALRRFIPMIASDAFELYREHGPEGLFGLAPAILGVPVQTYGSQIPNIEKTPAGEETIKLKNVPDLAETVVNKITGKQPSNIPLQQQQPLVEQVRAEKQNEYNREELKRSLQKGQVPQGVQPQDLKTQKLLFEYSSDQTRQVGYNFLYKDEDGKVQTIELNKIKSMPENSSYEKLLKETESYALVDKILENLPEDQKAQALSYLGINDEDATYYDIARQGDKLKIAWVNDAIGNLDTSNRENLINYLISGRKVVNNETLISTAVLTDLYDNGIISQSEKTMLKNLTIKDGKVKTKITGRGKKATLKKVSLPKSTKVKAPKIKTMAQLLPKDTKIRIKKYNFRNKL